MTRREELLQAPKMESRDDIKACSDLWIIPKRSKHESGYNNMVFVFKTIDERYVKVDIGSHW